MRSMWCAKMKVMMHEFQQEHDKASGQWSEWMSEENYSEILWMFDVSEDGFTKTVRG